MTTDPTTPSKTIPHGDLRRWLVWAWQRKQFAALAARLSPPALAYMLQQYGDGRLRREEIPSVAPVVHWLAARICNFGDRHRDLTDTFTRKQMIGGVWAKDGSLIQPGTGLGETQNDIARQRAVALGLMRFARKQTCLQVTLDAEGIVRYCADEVINWMRVGQGVQWQAVVRRIARETHGTSVDQSHGTSVDQSHGTSVDQSHGTSVDISSNRQKHVQKDQQQQAAAAASSHGSSGDVGTSQRIIIDALQKVGHDQPLPATITAALAKLTEGQVAGIAIRLQELHADGNLRSPVATLRAALQEPDAWQPHGTNLAALQSPPIKALRQVWKSRLRTTPSAHDLQALARGLLGTDQQKVMALCEYGDNRSSGCTDYGDPSRPITVKGILEHAPALQRCQASGDREHMRKEAAQAAARAGVTFDEKGKAIVKEEK